MKFDAEDPAEKPLESQARAELYDRMTSPLYALVGGVVAFAALGEARTTRQGRGLAILGAIGVFAAVRIFGFADALLLRGKGQVAPPTWVFLASWGVPLLAVLLSLDAIFAGPATRAFARARQRASLAFA